jgi:triosephosphate isomerase (TIM)
VTRKPLIAGNWKMNLNHLEAIAHVQRLAFSLNEEDFEEVDVLVLPPFTDMRSVQTLIDADRLRIAFGAQDLSDKDNGAYTGQISGVFLSKLGCKYALTGHSERRGINAESSELVMQKTKAALRNNITPIVCVGEPSDIRKNGNHVTYTLDQLEQSLSDLTKEMIKDIAIAYEPVWAIGTGEIATPQDAEQMVLEIRNWLVDRTSLTIAQGVRILYGGSVKSSTAAGIMAMPNIDVLLVGGASIDPDEFVGICRYRLAGV